jgi:hypothetical protein
MKKNMWMVFVAALTMVPLPTVSVVAQELPLSTACSLWSPNAGQVVLYRHIDYQGECTVLDAGEYESSSRMGIQNDSVSSIRVGLDAMATLCWHNEFGGVCETFVRNDPNLTANHLGNDTVSSARVHSSNGQGYRLVVRHSGKCLTGPGNTTQTQCGDSNHHRWLLMPVSQTHFNTRHPDQAVPASRSGNHYYILSQASGQCLTISGNGRVEVTDCLDIDKQGWRLEPISQASGYYRIRSVYSPST